MSQRAYITPAKAPDSFECRELFVPIGQSWEAIVNGVLSSLIDPSNYEQVTGLTPEQTAAVFEQTWLAWDGEKGCPMFAGMVVACARATAPDGWLACDGTTYIAADYQSLFDAIGVAFGSGGVGTFNVPDLRGRSAIGVGSGAGLTARTLAESGGEETHVLSEAELASHYHDVTYSNRASKDGTGTGWNAKMPGGTGVTVGTEVAGGGEAHENMSPFLALNFMIYAGQ